MCALLRPATLAAAYLPFFVVRLQVATTAGRRRRAAGMLQSPITRPRQLRAYHALVSCSQLQPAHALGSRSQLQPAHALGSRSQHTTYTRTM